MVCKHLLIFYLSLFCNCFLFFCCSFVAERNACVTINEEDEKKAEITFDIQDFGECVFEIDQLMQKQQKNEIPAQVTTNIVGTMRNEKITETMSPSGKQRRFNFDLVSSIKSLVPATWFNYPLQATELLPKRPKGDHNAKKVILVNVTLQMGENGMQRVLINEESIIFYAFHTQFLSTLLKKTQEFMKIGFQRKNCMYSFVFCAVLFLFFLYMYVL